MLGGIHAIRYKSSPESAIIILEVLNNREASRDAGFSLLSLPQYKQQKMSFVFMNSSMIELTYKLKCMKYSMWVLLLVMVVGMTTVYKNSVAQASRAELAHAMSQGALLVDVRTPAEFAEGSVKGAINIPLDQIQQHILKFKGGAKKHGQKKTTPRVLPQTLESKSPDHALWHERTWSE